MFIQRFVTQIWKGPPPSEKVMGMMQRTSDAGIGYQLIADFDFMDVAMLGGDFYSIEEVEAAFLLAFPDAIEWYHKQTARKQSEALRLYWQYLNPSAIYLDCDLELIAPVQLEFAHAYVGEHQDKGDIFLMTGPLENSGIYRKYLKDVLKGLRPETDEAYIYRSFMNHPWRVPANQYIHLRQHSRGIQ